MKHRPIFAKPRLTQDWDDHQEERETHWTSLFYDLLLVAALNALAEPFEELIDDDEDEEHPRLVPIRGLWVDALLKFAAVIFPWNNLNEYTSVFSADGLVGHHLLFFVHCFGIAATTQACVGDLSENYAELATGMALTRIGLSLLWTAPLLRLPRVRAHGGLRVAGQLVSAGIVAWGAATSDDYVGEFRPVLIASLSIELASMIGPAFLSRKHRIPFHVMGFASRINEITMVIFGEAIFAIVLRPFHDDDYDRSSSSSSSASATTRYYAALLGTLWLIYSLALQEFHVLPTEDQHALRRSVLAGASWINTNALKQVFLLGVSIGIKRIHLLTSVAPSDPVDDDTADLLIRGLSLTLASVALIRSYSFGWGRTYHPDDSPALVRTKTAWWTVLVLACGIPQIVDLTVLRTTTREGPTTTGTTRTTPLRMVVVLGIVTAGIILAEAVVSNRTADLEAAAIAGALRKDASPDDREHRDEGNVVHDDDEEVATEVSHLLGELD